jgi:hypothetical protein
MINKNLKFSEITNEQDLIQFLEKKVKETKNTKNSKNNYVYHYTNIKSVIGILKSKYWHLNTPVNMNDGLELRNSFQNVGKNIFFSSFMLEKTESIAMWSMYAQPWGEGVMIKIPVEKFKKWIKSELSVCLVEDNKANLHADITRYSKYQHLKSYAVAYCLEGRRNDELVCGGGKNVNLKWVKQSSRLMGYIKDHAWNYEKEVRLRVDLSTNELYDKIAIRIPDEVLDSIELVTGPRFEGTLLSKIHNEVDPEFNKNRITKSYFKGHLNWVYCDSCLKKRVK